MRIIAGKWRGRRLVPLKGRRIRPTADRVKEAMFSILGPDLIGATVLDLCSGTGGLGIEALSRGAQCVYFVDDSSASLAQVRRNLELLGVPEEMAHLCRAKAVPWFRDWRPRPAGEDWLVVSDPPYKDETARELVALAIDRAGEPGFRKAVVEHDRNSPPADPRDTAPRVEIRHYGGCGLTIIRSD